MSTLPFGNESRIKLSTAHPDLQKLFERVNEWCQCTIFTGSRSKAEQEDFFYGTNKTGINPDKKKLSKTLDSKHLIQSDGFSHAIDAGPDPVEWESANYKLDCIYFAGLVMYIAQEMYNKGEIAHKIRYGGDWNKNGIISDESFQDIDHFEIIA
jgi:peptidoglycan L-alanyl-D-glutamate endopeptidase CwlK